MEPGSTSIDELISALIIRKNNMNNRLPVSDIARFKREVLDVSPEAALPCNLPDHWLDMIARDLAETMEGDSDRHAAIPLALIIHIFAAKEKGKELSIPIEQLFERFSELRAEINLEIVRRKRGVKIEVATLETIFTNRTVRVERMPH